MGSTWTESEAIHQDAQSAGEIAAQQEAGRAMLASVPGIENARTCGTILALDYKVEGAGYLAGIGPRLLAHFREAGLLIRPLGNTAYLMPPYCIEPADLAVRVFCQK